MYVRSSLLPTQFHAKGSLQFGDNLLIWDCLPRLVLLDYLRLLIDHLQHKNSNLEQ